jgi:hypothetical protein
LLPVAALLLLVGGCHKRPALGGVPLEPPKDVRASGLTADEDRAVACALEIGREHDLVKSAVPVSVTKGPQFKGEPPDWKSGEGWTVRFVEKDLTSMSRDGSFVIMVRTQPCRVLRMLVPG